MKKIQHLFPFVLAILSFALISVIYFYPVLQGKKIYQSDIAQYIGMAKEQNDFRAAENQEPYWTNSAFGGMPTYQLGAKYPYDFIGKIDDVIRFLPRPADYLFLYFISFYTLLLVMKTDPLKAFFGSLAFGFSTYLIIILGVGHNAKAHAIGYLPLVISGIVLVFQKRWIWGGILTMLASGLELNANHLQMTYYALFLIIPICIYYTIDYLKEKDYGNLTKTYSVLAAAAILGIGVNATSLMATSEYAKMSTRGKSDLTLDENGKKKTSNNSMSYDYITEYSYGIAESLNLIAPRLFGGSNNETLDDNSSLYNFVIAQGGTDAEAKEFSQNSPTYWGDQPIVAAPAYIGAVVFFLALLGLAIDKRKIKWAFLVGALFSLVLSWGKNFPILTDFFIDIVPLYNKFRAVSSIQVILELCFPILAIMGLQSFYMASKDSQKRGLLLASGSSLGLIILVLLSKSLFSFAGNNDGYYIQQYGQLGQPFIEALRADRQSMFAADLLRSGFLIASCTAILWLSFKEKMAHHTAVILIGLFMVGDLFFIDKKYVDSKSFISAREVDAPYQPTQADLQILQDTSNYRVFEVDGNMSSARSSYFHKSIGGYSAVKPIRMQQLFDYQIAKNNLEVLNMLNVKYIIQTDEKGVPNAMLNPKANGNAWFVQTVKTVPNADAAMAMLKTINTKTSAIIEKDLEGDNLKKVAIKNNYVTDSTATISLKSYKPNYLIYQSVNKNDGFAVFSETYYKNGWNAYIDGQKAPSIRVDFVLRALQIPAGQHKIEFKFEPQVIKTGSYITLISAFIMMLVILFGFYIEKNKLKLSK